MGGQLHRVHVPQQDTRKSIGGLYNKRSYNPAAIQGWSYETEFWTWELWFNHQFGWQLLTKAWPTYRVPFYRDTPLAILEPICLCGVDRQENWRFSYPMSSYEYNWILLCVCFSLWIIIFGHTCIIWWLLSKLTLNQHPSTATGRKVMMWRGKSYKIYRSYVS